MQRFNFSTVFNILDSHKRRDIQFQKPELFIELFNCFYEDDVSSVSHENSAISYMGSGTAPLDSKIIDFYTFDDGRDREYYKKFVKRRKPKSEAERIIYTDKEIESHQKQFEKDILKIVFEKLYDSDMAVQEIYYTVKNDDSLSPDKREEIYELYPCESPSDKAKFICSCFLSCMERPFVKSTAITASGITSPVIYERIITGIIPPPCKYFCGRNEELTKLHKRLQKRDKVFVWGIPGIGKSELVKAYIYKYKSNYTNILHLTYSDDLHKLITDIDFRDDIVCEPETVRFNRHNLYLKSLQEDTLIVIDNFNVAQIQDDFLAEIMKYRCRIIFTTRSKFEDYSNIQVKEIADINTLVAFVGKHYVDTNNDIDTVTNIIETVHRHTFTVALSAHLLKRGILNADELLIKFSVSHPDIDSTDKIRFTKDGATTKETYYRHIQTLFSLCSLDENAKCIMRNMVFIPHNGVQSKLFAEWLGFSDMNGINDLIELGFIQETAMQISLHPIVCDVAKADLQPSVTNCSNLLNSLCDYCKQDNYNHKLTFQIVENIIKLITNDNKSKFFTFICKIYQYMHQQKYGQGMKLILSELIPDNAIYYHFQALYEEGINLNPEKALQLEEKALELCTDNDSLVSKINALMGYFHYHFGDYKRAEQHYRAAMKLHPKINCIEDMGDILDAAQQYINLILVCGMNNKALEILEKLSAKIREQFGNMCYPYADMVFYKGVVYFNSANEQQGWNCFRESIEIYNEIYKGDSNKLKEKIELIKAVIEKYNVTMPPDFTGLGTQVLLV